MGTDKLTNFCSKSGYSEQINQTIDAQSGALSSISGQSNSLCVAPAHGLELTCQYPPRPSVFDSCGWKDSRGRKMKRTVITAKDEESQ